MLQRMLNRVRVLVHHDRAARGGYTLRVTLWSVWTLVVGATAWLQWHADVRVHRALNLVGLTVHCGVVGILGLIVLTLIEIWLKPWHRAL